MSNGPRILTLDIETSPNVAHVWGLFKQTVSLNQLIESTEVISFAAKWHDSDEVIFYSIYDFEKKQITSKAKQRMLRAAHALIDVADIVIHYNGKSFDMPHLRREFWRYEMPPPSPVKEVDLLQAVRSQFRMTSNKLQYVSTYVGLEGKVETGGHELWLGCMAGDYDSWLLMREYNKWDVVQTELLYDRMLPWIPGHPHMGLYEDEVHACQRCGSTNLTKQGFAYTLTGKYQQYRCGKCKSWSRGKKNLMMVDERGIQ